MRNGRKKQHKYPKVLLLIYVLGPAFIRLGPHILLWVKPHLFHIWVKAPSCFGYHTSQMATLPEIPAIVLPPAPAAAEVNPAPQQQQQQHSPYLSISLIFVITLHFGINLYLLMKIHHSTPLTDRLPKRPYQQPNSPSESYWWPDTLIGWRGIEDGGPRMHGCSCGHRARLLPCSLPNWPAVVRKKHKFLYNPFSFGNIVSSKNRWMCMCICLFFSTLCLFKWIWCLKRKSRIPNSFRGVFHSMKSNKWRI